MTRRDWFLKLLASAVATKTAPIMAASAPSSTLGISMRYIKEFDIVVDKTPSMLRFHPDAYALIMKDLE